jgi:xylan 1,4-beta-xylosidase
VTDMMVKPAGENVGHGVALSDPFEKKLGLQWKRWDAGKYGDFIKIAEGELRMQALGASAADAAMIALYPGNHRYEAQVELDLVGDGAEAGLLLYYSEEKFVGIALKNGKVLRHGMWGAAPQYPYSDSKIYLRILNDRHSVSFFTSPDGINWTRCRQSSETSGYQHNVLKGFKSLKIGLYAAGEGKVIFRDFRYCGLNE